MRPLEVALITVVALAVLRPWTPLHRSRTLTVLVGAAPAVMSVVQVVIEGSRWQLIPLWLVSGAVLALAVRDALRRSRHETTPGETPVVPPRRISPVLLGLVIGASAVVAWSLPVVELPAPDGPYAVGTTTTFLLDDERTERYGPATGGPRILPLQVWYPTANGGSGEPAPWLLGRDRATSAAARDLGLPWFALGHLEMTTASAVVDAPPLAAGDLHLVLYAHGWSGSRELQVTQLESLASHGYLVIAADHTYASLATELPDGVIAALDEDALPDSAPQAEYDTAASQLVQTFAADLSAILDQVLEHGLLDDLVARERLEGLPVGLVGHSTGGGAAVLTCSRDPRCGVVVGYDPWVEPVPDTVVGADLAVPLLSIRSEEWIGTDNDVRLRRLHAGSSSPEGRVSFDGINHRDFTLLPLLSPMSGPLGLSGPLAGAGSLDDLDQWTVRFLDHHLRSVGPDPLLTPPEHHHTKLEQATDAISDPG